MPNRTIRTGIPSGLVHFSETRIDSSEAAGHTHPVCQAQATVGRARHPAGLPVSLQEARQLAETLDKSAQRMAYGVRMKPGRWGSFSTNKSSPSVSHVRREAGSGEGRSLTVSDGESPVRCEQALSSPALPLPLRASGLLCKRTTALL